MTGGAAPLPGWLADPALTPVWSMLRPRLEQVGTDIAGRLRLTDLDRDARHAVAGVLGRPLVAGTVVLDLAALDASLRERAGLGLRDVVALATGQPLRDRPSERAASAARREQPRQLLRELVRRSPVLDAMEWAPAWASDPHVGSALARADDVHVTAARAVAVVAELADLAGSPDVGEPVGEGSGARRLRVDLAVACAGDAHALDDGRPLTAAVLRGLARALGLDGPPRDARGRRELWERFGVMTDLVSATCLTVGLRPVGRDAFAGRLRGAADHGDVVHVTGRDLRSGHLRVDAGTAVLVCENPRIVEAFADSFRGGVSVVCTSGSPSLVTVDLLRSLKRGGAWLLYHGDFDWPGVDIANRLVAAAGVQPWMMTAGDYMAAATAEGLPLSGRAVEPLWDAELGAAMRTSGVAVHEEAVLDRLLATWSIGDGRPP